MAYIDRSKTVSWMTPGYVLDWWYDILQVDEFDVDPACHPQSLVRAKAKFCGLGVDDDGYIKDWLSFGQYMFTNPPFGERMPKLSDDAPPAEVEAHEDYKSVFHPCSHWIKKYDTHAQMGMVIAAVLPAATSNSWFHEYISTRSSAFCLLRKRIRFLLPQPDGVPRPGNSPGQAHMTVLWAHQRPDIIERFSRKMESHGLVIEPSQPMDAEHF